MCPVRPDLSTSDFVIEGNPRQLRTKIPLKGRQRAEVVAHDAAGALSRTAGKGWLLLGIVICTVGLTLCTPDADDERSIDSVATSQWGLSAAWSDRLALTAAGVGVLLLSWLCAAAWSRRHERLIG